MILMLAARLFNVTTFGAARTSTRLRSSRPECAKQIEIFPKMLIVSPRPSSNRSEAEMGRSIEVYLWGLNVDVFHARRRRGRQG